MTTTLSLGLLAGEVVAGNGSAAVVASDRPAATVVPSRLVLLNMLRREIAFMVFVMDAVPVSMGGAAAGVKNSLPGRSGRPSNQLRTAVAGMPLGSKIDATRRLPDRWAGRCAVCALGS